jgi:hypothetical protein
VVTLGYSGYVSKIRTGERPRQYFPKELQSLHVYGRLVVNKIQLVQMLGGVDKITSPAVVSASC